MSEGPPISIAEHTIPINRIARNIVPERSQLVPGTAVLYKSDHNSNGQVLWATGVITGTSGQQFKIHFRLPEDLGSNV